MFVWVDATFAVGGFAEGLDGDIGDEAAAFEGFARVGVGLLIDVDRGLGGADERAVGEPLTVGVAGCFVGGVGPDGFRGEVGKVDEDDVFGVARKKRGLARFIEDVVRRGDFAREVLGVGGGRKTDGGDRTDRGHGGSRKGVVRLGIAQVTGWSGGSKFEWRNSNDE